MLLRSFSTVMVIMNTTNLNKFSGFIQPVPLTETTKKLEVVNYHPEEYLKWKFRNPNTIHTSIAQFKLQIFLKIGLVYLKSVTDTNSPIKRLRTTDFKTDAVLYDKTHELQPE